MERGWKESGKGVERGWKVRVERVGEGERGCGDGVEMVD